MAKGNEFSADIEGAVSLDRYNDLGGNGTTKKGRPVGSTPPRGEASDVEPRRRGRKRGSLNSTSLAGAEPRRRKRDSEVLVGERIRRLRIEAGLSQEEL